MTTTLDTTLMEELTTSLGGCIGTLEMALAVAPDPVSQRALVACLSVLSTSHEHLCRVDAMVFSHEREEAPSGPLVMGQPEEECLCLDLVPGPGGMLLCPDCAKTVEVITRHPDVVAAAELEAVIAEHFPGAPGE